MVTSRRNIHRAIGMALIAAVLAASGCSDPAEDPAASEAEAAANTLFAATCAGLGAGPSVCACVRDRVEAAAGMAGVAYIGAAYGGEPELAAPFEEAMSQEERNVAAEAFLDAQFDCVMAADSDYSDAPAGGGQPGPGAPPAPAAPPAGMSAESPLEAAVEVCVETGAASETACRCRAETMMDALGEDGLILTRAAEAADETALRALADRLGEAWLAEGARTLSAARTACGA